MTPLIQLTPEVAARIVGGKRYRKRPRHGRFIECPLCGEGFENNPFYPAQVCGICVARQQQAQNQDYWNKMQQQLNAVTDK